MRRWLGYSSIACIMAVAGAWGYHLHSRSRAPANVSIEQPVLELGPLAIDCEHEISVLVRNHGTTVARIIGVDEELC